jgi:hypothetical protein
MVVVSTNEVSFWISLKKNGFTGSVTPKSRQKDGVVFGFPAKLGESIKTHISVKSRDIDTKKWNCRWKLKRTH